MTHRRLERDLGLYAIVTISVGAMITDIFVLPGLAAKIAGPAVMLAYLLAGLITLPAALSQSEMATAMPEAGGTYLYVDRALGPMLGTVAGIGVWFSLVLKSAFALVGLGAYLRLFVDLPTKPVALTLALLVLVVNALGVKQTGRLQAVIVTGVLAVMVLFVLRGAAVVDAHRYQPFLSHGLQGLLAATGFVFVSYAGVTKIASVAEEVRAPGRNIPIGILLSLGMMMVVYTGLIYVVVGTTPADALHATLTPMAIASKDILGLGGEVIISVTAVLALISMANAGVLSSSRYPFAMSRGELAPPLFRRVHPRFGTPLASIGLTGAALLVLIAFLPVVDLAKLASAFQILVLSFVNLALIAFREGRMPTYRPTFRSPGYPWVQLAGIVLGLLLITQMGWLSIVGALAIVAVGLLWFRAYGRPRTEREGVALAALRRSTDNAAVGHTRRALHAPASRRLLLPVHPHLSPAREADLLRLAGLLVDDQDGIRVVRFEQVPEQVELVAALRRTPPEDVAFETRVRAALGRLGPRLYCGEVVGHDWKESVVLHAREHRIDVVLTDEIRAPTPLKPFSRDAGWLMDRSGADVVALGPKPLGDIREVVVMGTGGPFDALKVDLASRIARSEGARIRFMHIVSERVLPAQLETLRAYHEQLAALCGVSTSSDIRRAAEPRAALAEASRGSDLAVLGATVHRYVGARGARDLAHRLAASLECPALIVHAQLSHRRTVLGTVLERIAYRSPA
ncbi:MAG TPA: amino acid permease [Trueperaceae bacterium]|nr:amino acid permease [Trueperaceae bacterium]